jgi:maleylacetoacetate isomerase
MKPTLYQYFRSSASWRARWALAIKGVDFDIVSVDLAAGEQRSDTHRARNPIGHVPALAIDGVMLAETVAILEYLEETIPNPPLYPKTPIARARVRQIVELINAGTQPLQNLAVIARHSSEKDEQKAWMAHFNERGLLAVERVLEGLTASGERSTFAVGDALTAADIYLVPQLTAARRLGVDLTKMPILLAVEAAALATPHAKGALPENQPDAKAL